MSDSSWLRRRGREPGSDRNRAAEDGAASSAAALGGQQAGPADTPSAEVRDGYLRRAAECYLRAGQVTDAASYLSTLGEHGQAALLYERSGDFAAAAQAYADQGDIEGAAWTHVHQLADAPTARELLSQAVPMDSGRPQTSSWPSPAELWRPRFSELHERVAGLAPGDEASEKARADLAAVISRLLGAAPAEVTVKNMAGTLRPTKLALVEAGDWAAAYAARELERLLSELAAATAETERARAQGVRMRIAGDLARRQVAARCDVAEGMADNSALLVLTETQDALADAANADMPERVETWGVAIAQAMRRYDQAALVFAAAVRGGRPGASARWRDWSARVLRADTALPAGAEVA